MKAQLLALALLVGIATPACAQPVDDLERDDSQALSAAWRLQTGNARYCPHVTRQTGIQLEDTAVYAQPALVRSTYGLTGDIYIGAIAATGPGAAVPVNATVMAIDGRRMSALPAPDHDAPFTRWHTAQAMLDDDAARDGHVDLTLSGPGARPGTETRTVHIVAVPACKVTVKVDDQQSYASANREEIRLGRHYLDAAHGDPDLIAALIAHEMAHAVLDHQTQLEASNKAMAVVRRTEHEADRLSVWLLANAGYPPEAAIALQAQVIARLIGPFNIDLTHGGWHSRAARIEHEIATLKAAPDADWPKRFVREP
ncbi:hypothetical protein [Novosphingobium sp.]|uniref:hypothetical protein n=1 Tax=Novosphingobium sp. TaxID=1874826 RepID=UPI003B52339E